MDFRDSLVVTYYYTDAYVGKAREYMEKFSVKKPFTILVMVVAIIILGFVSLSGMTTDLLPKMSLPYLLVITTYPGASPEKVESSVSEPVESAGIERSGQCKIGIAGGMRFSEYYGDQHGYDGFRISGGIL